MGKSFPTFVKTESKYDNIFNVIHSPAIKQHLEIAAIWPHRLSGPIMLQITLKYFNVQITVVYCKSIQLKTFA